MKMRDDRDESNGGKVKRFAYASSKANKETSAEEWDLFGPKKKQSDGLGGLDDLDDVWSIRKNVSLSNGLKTNNTSTKPPVNPSLTSNTGFYSRHGQYNGKNSMLSPATSPSDFPRSSGSVWNQPRGGGYSYSQQEGNSSHDFNDSSSPRDYNHQVEQLMHHQGGYNHQVEQQLMAIQEICRWEEFTQDHQSQTAIILNIMPKEGPTIIGLITETLLKLRLKQCLYDWNQYGPHRQREYKQ
ncbi:uncharacterized protein [Amphiura filiformis]|uniref:uncharacterized protein n=1 Tax=Amphiura filiformis TaxID=82378 RepID=UPI003B21E909